MPGRMEFKFGFDESQRPRPAGGGGDRPMRLLVLGDFSAKPAAERPPLASRPTQRVDIDSLDTVMQRLAPALKLPAGNVDFTQLDDFHPDALYQRLELFDALRQARAKPPSGGGGDLLGQLLGKTEAPATTPAPAATGLDALIRNIVAPHIVQDTSATVKPYIAAVDAAITEQMRKLLHDPAFQALESAWKGVQWLIANLELDDDPLQLHLFDVTRDELLADVVNAGGQLANTGLYKALADRWRNVPGGHGWSFIAGLYDFGPGDADVGLLAALGLIASQAGGPFVARGLEALVTAPTEGWLSLRRSEAAPWIGLAAPRVLLRLPYGPKLDPVSSFGFEELPPGQPEHEHLLWGNPALAVALLVGRGGSVQQIDDLPAYTYTHDGERELQACAERYLGEQAGLAFIASGLMPVMSHRHANAVTVMRVQSVASGSNGLAGLGSGD